MTEMSKDYPKAAGGTCENRDRERQTAVATEGNNSSKVSDVMQEVVRRENLKQALKRVCANKGAAGVDGMNVEALKPHLKEHWPELREELLTGTYIPQPVLRVEIPKEDGKGMRALGIPTVLDRFIQQAILQVLTPIFDPHFSEHSYGFRPGRNCHQAVKEAREYVAAGYRYVVDMDMEKFFDRVNHDLLMGRVARGVKDKKLLLLIRRYLNSGVMAGEWKKSEEKAHRREARCLRFCPTYFWMTWIRNWRTEDTGFAVTPTTATSMLNRRRQGSG